MISIFFFYKKAACSVSVHWQRFQENWKLWTHCVLQLFLVLFTQEKSNMKELASVIGCPDCSRETRTSLSSFFNRKTAQNSKNKPENLRWTFFWLHCSDCLELAAGWPESFSLPPNCQSWPKNAFSAKLSDWFVHANRYLFHICVCVRVCHLGAGVGTGRDGIKGR